MNGTALGVDIGGTSVKAAILRPNGWKTGRSLAYTRPAVEQLRRAILEAIGEFHLREVDGATAVGVCLPGVYDPVSGTIQASANIPAIVGVRVRELLPEGFRDAVIVPDALAAAYGYWTEHRAEMAGRALMLSLGTGVGAAVLDDGVPLRVNGFSPGHFGQLDVTLNDADPATPIGPDGGRGSLEAYVGLAALRQRYGDDAEARVMGLSETDPPLRALARAIRIGHAMYRSNHVVLLGGVGVRLKGSLPALRRCVEDQLTRLARPGWTLGVGDHELHGAQGAAKWAVQERSAGS